ncbi:hypothetical protein S83_001403, partial [Arachis hypogaea]
LEKDLRKSKQETSDYQNLCWQLEKELKDLTDQEQQMKPKAERQEASNASNSNEQHDMETNSARVAANEDVAKNSKDLFEQFDVLITNSYTKQALGGRVRILLLGAAPLPRHVEEFMRVTSGSTLSQGYGKDTDATDMGKKGSWFSEITRVFTHHSKEKQNSVFTLQNLQQSLFTTCKIINKTRAPSPRAPSPRAASLKAPFLHATSPKATSFRVVHHHKEVGYRPEPTLRRWHQVKRKNESSDSSQGLSGSEPKTESEKEWAIRLLSIACLSLASKMEKCSVPELSVFQSKDYCFESKVIRRMEILVLTTLDWNMSIITPYDFLPYFITKFCNQPPETTIFSKTMQLIFTTIKEVGIMDHKPSVVAAAATLVSSDQQLTIEVVELKISSIPQHRFLDLKD